MPQVASFDAVDWYDVPLYYDIIFSQGTEQERDFLIKCHRAYGPPEVMTALEPACGSGRLVAALAEAGYQVTGFDLSAPMLDFAKKRLADAKLEAHLFEAPMESFKCAPVALAHNLVSTFKYVLTEEGAVSHLQHVAKSLVPSGIYVLGFHLTDYDDARLSRERWCASRGRSVVTCNIQTWPADKKARTEQIRSRLVVKEGRKTKKFETCWPFRTYNARQVRALLRQVPELEHVATFDFGYDLTEPRPLDDNQLDVVLILRRRAPGPTRARPTRKS